MIDIKCCSCNAWSRDIEQLLEGGYYTVQSGFTKSAGESCDNCGHDFCEKCEHKAYDSSTQSIKTQENNTKTGDNQDE